MQLSCIRSRFCSRIFKCKHSRFCSCYFVSVHVFAAISVRGCLNTALMHPQSFLLGIFKCKLQGSPVDTPRVRYPNTTCGSSSGYSKGLRWTPQGYAIQTLFVALWDGSHTREVVVWVVSRKISQTILRRCLLDSFTCQKYVPGFPVAKYIA